MNLIRSGCALFAIFLFSAFALTQWRLVPDSYSVKVKGSRVSATLKGLEADIRFDPKELNTSVIRASVDATTFSTGNFLKNMHAKSEEGLNTDQFPKIEYRSAKITAADHGFEAQGNLTLKGTTKPVLLRFTFENGGQEGLFRGTFTINPKDFGVTRNGTPDRITVSLNVPVRK
ncbi:MAG: YceI family protein [Mucilaginibacter polytrichastri]|nr:YceI family protein [Mucilaginibacter polytrichastri]